MQMKLLLNSLIHFDQDINIILKDQQEQFCEFTFDLVQVMHYKCQRVNFRRSVSYIVSPDWMKKKKKQR